MFSGIIEHKAQILKVDNGVITVANNFGENLEIGQSIAHDGACMTITRFDNNTYSFFAMEESFKRTNFGSKNVGDFFNVERSLNFGGKVDGHFVTGHIDCKGTIKSVHLLQDKSLIINVHFPTEFKNNIIEKGSISINGVSLTVIDVGNDYFSVSLIPLTQDITNLGALKKGDVINLEFDMMGKYILKYMDNLNKVT